MATTTQWECQLCTYMNTGGIQCDICGNENKVEGPEPCPICTCVPSFGARFCEACGFSFSVDSNSLGGGGVTVGRGSIEEEKGAHLSKAREIAVIALGFVGGDISQAATDLFFSSDHSEKTPIEILATTQGSAEVCGINSTLAQALWDECSCDASVACTRLLQCLTEEAAARVARGENISQDQEDLEWGGSPLLSTPNQGITCDICLDEKSRGEWCKLGCGHSYCLTCLRGHCEQARSEPSKLNLISCPCAGCPRALTQRELRGVLGLEAFSRLDRAQLENAALLDPTLHLCPSPDCPNIVSWKSVEEDGAPIIDCPLCKKSACLVCRAQPKHPGLSCAEAANLLKANSATEDFFNNPSSGIKICAKCKTPLVLTLGCMKIKCRCGYRFCWQCGAPDAKCPCTPSFHGFWDNRSGQADFS